MTRKVLWLVDGELNGLLERAQYVGAQAVCIRTTNDWLKGAVQQIKNKGFDVYAWRWPAVRPTIPPPAHYYADDEAHYAMQLIKEGLDGYIVDPESDAGHSESDWNNTNLADLANRFCDTIKLAGRKAISQFLFGTTSGCNYPTQKKNIPWSVFIAHSDAVFPQIYWAPNIVGRHTPEDAYKIGMASWKTIIPKSMRICPIIGEIKINQPGEINRFGQIINTDAIDEVHFYSYVVDVPPTNWEALKNFGQAPIVA
jgi:hypothetical protein